MKSFTFYLLVSYQCCQSQFQKQWWKTRDFDRKVKDKGLNDFIFSLFPLASQVLQEWCMGPGGWHTCKRFQSQLKDPEMRKLLSCLRKYKPTYLIFSTQADIIFFFLDSKQTCRLSCREIISLFSKAACYMDILEKIVKSWEYFCLDYIQKHNRPMESCVSTPGWHGKTGIKLTEKSWLVGICWHKTMGGRGPHNFVWAITWYATYPT